MPGLQGVKGEAGPPGMHGQIGNKIFSHKVYNHLKFYLRLVRDAWTIWRKWTTWP
jgi:hypothetical protein